ncbi:MAG: HypC/HybG/HupF family hydrogenase formation chaperone [Bacteroidota bacterium]|jgi:hydrogenase expression/formation protein HypC|nr:HypC/HybG/HupF family hydrogenase formation chaperone [Bacteroidota bacterium]
MCLAVPAKVLELRDNQMALVDLGGTQREISLMVLDGEVAPDQYVLVHVGYAIEVIDEDEARRTLELFEEFQALDERESLGSDTDVPDAFR